MEISASSFVATPIPISPYLKIEPFAKGVVVTKSSGVCRHYYQKDKRPCIHPTTGICCQRHKKFESLYLTWQENLLNKLATYNVYLQDSEYEIHGGQTECGKSH